MILGDFMEDNRCPLCGVKGRVWHKKPAVFKCPNCFSVYSEFGMVIETGKELQEGWS